MIFGLYPSECEIKLRSYDENMRPPICNLQSFHLISMLMCSFRLTFPSEHPLQLHLLVFYLVIILPSFFGETTKILVSMYTSPSFFLC